MRVDPPHVIALLISHHLEGKLIVVTQERSPLAGFGNLGRLVENIDDRKTVLHFKGHIHPRHEREVKIHMALVAIPEILGSIFRPLVCLGKQHPVRELVVNMLAKTLQKLMRTRQVFAV